MPEYQAHRARLRQEYAAIPPGQPVRLAKSTSNLFRTRQRSAAPGLDVRTLDGVIAVVMTAIAVGLTVG